MGRPRIHGYTRKGFTAPEYTAWRAMKSRCNVPKNPSYRHYGGRGITVCDEWSKSFPTFLKDVGARPSKYYSLERINNDGNYEPGNVVWADPITQHNNTRANHTIEAFGENLTMVQWARKTGINYFRISQRLSVGWTPERAVSQPVGSNKRGRNSLPVSNEWLMGREEAA
jgi:hypothetical protein